MTNRKTPSLFWISIIGALLSIIAFSLFVTIVVGTTLILIDSFQTFWTPILISFSVIFLILCAVNIFLYAVVILNKNRLIKKEENEFSFWISSFVFWILPLFSWIIFVSLYLKEQKDEQNK